MKSKLGLSLVEIIISMLLLSALVAGTFGAFVGIRCYINLSRHKVQAMNFAQQRMERLRLQTYSGLSTGGWTNDPLPPGELSDLGGTRQYRVRQFTPNESRRLEVRVRWQELDIQHEEIISTLVGNGNT